MGERTDTYRVALSARKAGAIGQMDAEKRVYWVTATGRDAAEDEARRLAYAEGLEHTTITECVVRNSKQEGI